MLGFERITLDPQNPYLEPEDIQEALRYATWLAEENVFPSPG